MHQTTDEDFRRQLFRMIKMDVRVRVDSSVFVPKRAV